ncbi:MAG: histidinol-phosphatase [Clostridia bacterium]|nr:histidinol-phosphatase [Clostridia bacterium]
MVYADYHMHTTYCDGKCTAEEMILSAIAKGLTTVGLSGHGFTDFDGHYCMSRENSVKYAAEVTALKEKYKDKIRVLLGVEQDYFGGKPIIETDYVIGSVHYLHWGNDVYTPIDEHPDQLMGAVNAGFGGDIYAAAESYFQCMGDVVRVTGADIIGHFDLISKFCERGITLDFDHPRYKKAYTDAIDRLIPYGKPFEVNTGAISRGYRTSPYPAMPMMRYIASQGGKIIFTSDSHHVDNIAFRFEEWEPVYRAFGTEVVIL